MASPGTSACSTTSSLEIRSSKVARTNGVSRAVRNLRNRRRWLAAARSKRRRSSAVFTRAAWRANSLARTARNAGLLPVACTTTKFVWFSVTARTRLRRSPTDSPDRSAFFTRAPTSGLVASCAPNADSRSGVRRAGASTPVRPSSIEASVKEIDASAW
jgi:hypothetical protein